MSLKYRHDWAHGRSGLPDQRVEMDQLYLGHTSVRETREILLNLDFDSLSIAKTKLKKKVFTTWNDVANGAWKTVSQEKAEVNAWKIC